MHSVYRIKEMLKQSQFATKRVRAPGGGYYWQGAESHEALAFPTTVDTRFALRDVLVLQTKQKSNTETIHANHAQDTGTEKIPRDIRSTFPV